MTGREGLYHTKGMLAAGTTFRGGVRRGRGGETVEDQPVFDTVREARAATGANVSCIFVPPLGAADAIMEVAAAGVELVVCITEGIPVNDMTRVAAFLKEHPTRLIGPNCPGVATPGAGKVGIMPYHIMTPGRVGFVSRSGTLTYEVVALLTGASLGQSSIIGIGGDPIIGTTFIDCLRLFVEDPATDVVGICGEIGGREQEDAAAYAATMTQPGVGFIPWRPAPPGQRMGLAGAILSGQT